jgi:hypothetical protein
VGSVTGSGGRASRDQPLTLAPDELAELSEKRERFCADLLREPILAAEIADNQIDWTRLNLQCLIHRGARRL